MKLATILILSICLHASAKGRAQNMITFSGKEVSLESVFNAIKKQTTYRFFFNSDMLQRASKISIDVKNAPLEQVMFLALKDQPLTYTIKGRTIFIMKKAEEPKTVQAAPVTGDPITVSGRVTDDKGQPLVGANVKVKGGDKGVVTDGQGRFTLNGVDPNATLEVSFVGYDMQLLAVKGKTVLGVALGKRLAILDETVIIGYGTTTKRLNTGNVSSIKAVDIERQPINNPLLALQGRVPGLVITQSTGLSGGGVNITVQGQNSIRQSANEPLIIVNGVPFPTQIPASGITSPLGGTNGFGAPGSPLAYINPSDIESIEVLKDADATAIYGSRGANGVILITTKRGKVGKTLISVNAQQGVGKVARKMKMLNTRQYLDMRYEAIKNDGLSISSTSSRFYDLTAWDTTRYTDWQKEYIGGNAKLTNINATISGGTNNIQYLVGATFNRQTTVFPGDFDDRKSTINFNINSYSTNKKLSFQLSGMYAVGHNRLPGVDYTQFGVLTEPHAPSLYNEDGSLNWAPNQAGTFTLNNPLRYNLIQYSNRTNSLVSNAVIGYAILPGLQFSSSFGYTDMQISDYVATPQDAIRPDRRVSQQRQATYGYRNLNSWIIEPQLGFKRDILKGKIDFLLGATILENNSGGQTIAGSGYNSDAVLKDILSAPTITANASVSTVYRYNALFGRLNLNWQNKYIVNLTARRDGSTRFGIENRFHNFSSAAFAWLFSNEGFFNKGKHILSFGKFKASYGTTGSDQISDYLFMSLYSPVSNSLLTTPYQGIIGLTADGINNPYLEWEENKKLNLGIDLGFCNDRILVGINYALNRSSNQLVAYSLPTTTGFSSITKNFPATVQNTSLEVTLSTINYKRKNFSWSTSLNLTVPTNKLVRFPGIESSTYSQLLIEGKPLSFYRLYHYLGVDPSTGLYQAEGLDGNPTSNPNSIPYAETPIIKSAYPKCYGGVQNTLDIKNVQIDFLVQIVQQYIPNIFFFNGLAGAGQFISGSSNQPVTVLDRWRKVGDIASVRKYSTTSYFDTEVFLAASSYENYTSGSFLRLKNLSVSWQLPEKLIGQKIVQSCRLYILAQNLFTLSSFKGLDPETKELTVLPPLRMVTAGIKVQL